MHTSQKKSDRLKSDDKPSKKMLDEKLKKSTPNVTTPHSFAQRRSAVDVYGQKKNVVNSARAPKKVVNTSVSGTKDYLKSSPSSISQTTYDRTPTFKKESKPQTVDLARRTSKATKSVPLLNVTVNSPVVKRKLNLNREPDKVFKKIDSSQGLYIACSVIHIMFCIYRAPLAT